MVLGMGCADKRGSPLLLEPQASHTVFAPGSQVLVLVHAHLTQQLGSVPQVWQLGSVPTCGWQGVRNPRAPGGLCQPSVDLNLGIWKPCKVTC